LLVILAIFCPYLPAGATNAESTVVPWSMSDGDSVYLVHPGIDFTGNCIGQNYLENEYEEERETHFKPSKSTLFFNGIFLLLMTRKHFFYRDNCSSV
jgi:hypothetical protein